MAVTIHFQSTGIVPGQARPVSLIGRSLTIGRGEDNDLVLPDPDKLISKRHCAIEDHDGNIIVVDFSTNGTFLNYGKVALGKVQTPLNNGDILSVGGYELLVEITAAKGPAPSGSMLPPLDDLIAPSPSLAPLAPAPGLMPGGRMPEMPMSGEVDFLDDLLGLSTPPSGHAKVQRLIPDDDGLLPPLDPDDLLAPPADPMRGQGGSLPEHNPAMEDHMRMGAPVAASGNAAPPAIPDDWDDFLAPLPGGAEQDDPFAQPDVAAPVPPPPQPLTMPGQPATVPPLAGRSRYDPNAPGPGPGGAFAASGQGDAAARAFLQGLGAGHLAVSDAELPATMARLGRVMAVMIEGVREVLMTRTQIKSEFRISQTVIGAGDNNPLKFSISPEQAVEAMVKPTTRGYLGAVESAEQALRDVKAHEVAMLTGMEAALRGILKRLDPAVLEAKIETSGGFGSILRGKKQRTWEVYEKMYAEIADQAENDFNELFAREFARSYQDQLERLK